MRHIYFVRTQYAVIKIKSLSYNEKLLRCFSPTSSILTCLPC
ncbi:hypothetical protein ARSQ2_02467 [Arsenophonus endosymbiont of Bemisia tabaci Q2]|nr:hypothetical protein ARSQ2_02467 [Arsenophonus endosymbiont of Bemisia tabaci Q2]